MAGQVVQMDYAVVGDVSKGFDVASKTLTAIGKVLQVLIGVLMAKAFFSFGTTAAMAKYLEVIRQKVENLAKICSEFSRDLAAAIKDHQNGDYRGKRYFGEGVRR